MPEGLWTDIYVFKIEANENWNAKRKRGWNVIFRTLQRKTLKIQ